MEQRDAVSRIISRGRLLQSGTQTLIQIYNVGAKTGKAYCASSKFTVQR